MKSDNNIKFKIEPRVLKNYIQVINSINEPMVNLKNSLKYLEENTKKVNKDLDNIICLSCILKNYSNQFQKQQTKIFTDLVKQILVINNGIVSTKMIDTLNISRQYLAIMEKNDIIERVTRGVYLSTKFFEDSYYFFQQKYKKAIFSHMNSLYFYGITEEFPDIFTVTVPQSYHTNTLNKSCNVFYVSDDIYNLGLIEVKTPSGNKVKAYDKERCICDIIRSKGRMDAEQVKKVIKQYLKSPDKNLTKLSTYAIKMGINTKVMETIGEFI